MNVEYYEHETALLPSLTVRTAACLRPTFHAPPIKPLLDAGNGLRQLVSAPSALIESIGQYRLTFRFLEFKIEFL